MCLFEKDIFISYAHADNEPWGPQNDRWINSFHTSLETRLQELLGRPPVIWRDNKLRGTHKFGHAIVHQFHRTKILLAVLSPNYMTSKWCRKELQAFFTHAQMGASPDIGNQSRICKVIKTYVAHEDHPPQIAHLLGYEFHRKDSDGRFQDFKSYLQSLYCGDYWQKLEEVADDLAKLIQKIEGRAVQVPSTPQKTIYLAETTSDLKYDRKKIEQELVKEGFTILPDQPLMPDENFRQNAQTYLSQCKLSIHLVGTKYGSIPEDEETSIVEIQDKLASEQAQMRLLSRLIWIAPVMEITGSRQKALIRTLENDAPGQRGTQLVKNSLEDFKTIIEGTLRNLLKPRPRELRSTGGPMRIYLMHDQVDENAVEPVVNCLFNCGFEVKMPLFEGSPSQLGELHRDYLRLCEAMMIYYGDTNHAWLESKLNDISKARGFERTKPIYASAVYIAGEKTPHKERFRTHEAEVIRHFGPFQRELLEPFITRLQNGNGGTR